MKRYIKTIGALVLTAVLALGVFTPAAVAAPPGVITGTATFVSSAEAMGVTEKAVAQRTPFRYSDAWFAAPSTRYNHELARMSLTLQMTSWTAAEASNADNRNSPKLDNTGRTRAAAYLHQLYKDMGYKPLRYYHYDAPFTDEDDKAAWGMAEKRVKLGGKDCVLLSVSIRGGNYGGEWVSNGNVGNTTAHAAFLNASKDILSEVEKQVASYAENLTVKLWINGYSRGGAIANLMAGALDKAIAAGESRLKKDDLFCYNYAVPLCTKDKKANTEMFSNIFNIINPVDVIMIAPFRGWGFRRYGIEMFLNFLEGGKEFDRLNAQYAKYFNNLSKEEFTLHLTTWEQFKTLYLIDAIAPAFMKDTRDLMGFQFGMQNLIRAFFVEGTLVPDAESGNWEGVYEGIFGKADKLWPPVYKAVSALTIPGTIDPALITLILCALEKVAAELVKRPPNPLHIMASLPGLAVSIARFAMATSDSEDEQGFADNIKVAHSPESYTVLMGRPEGEAFGNGEIKGLKVT